MRGRGRRRQRAPLRRAASPSSAAAPSFALAVDPGRAARAQQSRARRAPTGSTSQGRLDEARVEADLAAALDPTSVDVQLERASLLQSLNRPADARRAVERAISLAPKDSQVWLQLAGYERWCWNDTTAWRIGLAHARSLSGHDNVFTAPTPTSSRRATPARERTVYVPRMMTSLALPACAGVMPSSGVTNCTLPTSFASLRAAGP